ncbi:neurogenic locus Notch protein [Trichonephila clavata]|uniref:Neurogenic locus Notch protein n=1 Tax=Trichonephila clavata TaxID=2740835 RepID=A0A8X6HN83_TRICU|nr:neurogenic locus Notch protein [Trichonephila clavata]
MKKARKESLSYSEPTLLNSRGGSLSCLSPHLIALQEFIPGSPDLIRTPLVRVIGPLPTRAECDCGPNSLCSFFRGEKKCNCNEGYQENYGKCEECSCGGNGGCSFVRGEKMCNCSKGYEVEDGVCKECDCGSHGRCSFKNSKKTCECENHFQEADGKCIECYCGENGKCEVSEGSKACLCEIGYLENNGKCEECDCGENGHCAFVQGRRTCKCSDKLADLYGKCTECDCGARGICEFQQGSKVCICEANYAEKDGRCAETCEYDSDCANGGRCEHFERGKFCDCLSGTSGDRCETITDCEIGKYRDCRGHNGSCVFDVTKKTAACECPEGKALHPTKNICREECNDCENGGTCHRDEAGNFCTCLPGTSGRGCEIVNDCVDGRYRYCESSGGTCTFNISRKNATCSCGERRAFNDTEYRCRKCDCGTDGECQILQGCKVCLCKDKYADKDGKCTETCEYDSDCANGGRCEHYKRGKFCDCLSGTSGDRCEIIIDCETGKYRDCRGHNGSCVFDVIKKTSACECPEGKVLHPTKNICRDTCNDCENGGTCHRDDAGNFCTCVSGTSGRWCEIVNDCVHGRYRYCSSSGGTCMFDEVSKNATCLCGERRAFNHTEYKCRECDCGRRGACEFRDGRKVCICEQKYGDKNGVCTEKCNEDDDCLNGARCLLNFCHCPAGLRGDKCEIIDDCETGKYKNCSIAGGECRYDVDRMKAVCVCPGKKVFDLRRGICKDLNPCEPSPCVHGHCVTQREDFQCICDNPFTGRYCEISTCIQTKCFGGRCKLYGDREECHCPLGHRLENGTCLKNYCVEKKCFNGICVIEDGIETCLCEEGSVYEENECRKVKCSHRHCIGGECRVVRANVEECVCPLGFILIDGICTITNCTPRRCYGGRCENREGQLVCICPDGFHLEGVGCIETQCKEQNCFGGHCRVVKGEEICTCLDNYVLKDNQCQKIRCVDRSCFGGKCDVVDGEEVCSCPVGFEPHGDVCREIYVLMDFKRKRIRMSSLDY